VDAVRRREGGLSPEGSSLLLMACGWAFAIRMPWSQSSISQWWRIPNLKWLGYGAVMSVSWWCFVNIVAFGITELGGQAGHKIWGLMHSTNQLILIFNKRRPFTLATASLNTNILGDIRQNKQNYRMLIYKIKPVALPTTG